MKLVDLIPYFELYKRLKDEGIDTILNKELEKKEKEFTGREITLLGIISEIDKTRNELIATYCSSGPEDYPLAYNRLISQYYFIFASVPQLQWIPEIQQIENDDLVKMVGTINSLHRHSTIRVTLTAINLVKKNQGHNKMHAPPKGYLPRIKTFFRKFGGKKSSF
jgi:hypothetical protein